VSRHTRCAVLHCDVLHCTVLSSCTLSSVSMCGLSCCCCTSHAVQHALIPCARALPAAARFSPESSGRIAAVRAAWRPASACRRRLLRVHAANAHGASPVEPTCIEHNQPTSQASALPLRRHRCAAAAIVSTGAKLVVPAVLVRRARRSRPRFKVRVSFCAICKSVSARALRCSALCSAHVLCPVCHCVV
jgi:hypothetical protein